MAAIIFDFDGTIADSFDYVVEVIAKEAKLDHVSQAQKDSLRHMSMVGMARNLGIGWWRMPFVGVKGRKQMEAKVRQLQPFKGLPEILEKLHAEGHELFILSTNSLRNLHAFLHHHDLHKYFLEVYGSVGYFNKTSAIKSLIKEQNLNKKDCIYVGDEVRDVQAAQAAKVRVVAVLWGFASPGRLHAKHPTAVAEQPAELLSILESV